MSWSKMTQRLQGNAIQNNDSTRPQYNHLYMQVSYKVQLLDKLDISPEILLPSKGLCLAPSLTPSCGGFSLSRGVQSLYGNEPHFPDLYHFCLNWCFFLMYSLEAPEAEHTHAKLHYLKIYRGRVALKPSTG